MSYTIRTSSSRTTISNQNRERGRGRGRGRENNGLDNEIDTEQQQNQEPLPSFAVPVNKITEQENKDSTLKDGNGQNNTSVSQGSTTSRQTVAGVNHHQTSMKSKQKSNNKRTNTATTSRSTTTTRMPSRQDNAIEIESGQTLGGSDASSSNMSTDPIQDLDKLRQSRLLALQQKTQQISGNS